MSIKIRRIVTDHDAQGRAKILIDEQVGNVISPHWTPPWPSPVRTRPKPHRSAAASSRSSKGGVSN
jgi:hypothetical protein